MSTNPFSRRRSGTAEAVSPAAVPQPKVIDSSLLLGSGREVRIRHKGGVYTLRETRQGKLILNK